MVNEMLKSISTQLHSEFGDDYTYYLENVEQGLTKPCFTMDALIPILRSRSRYLYDRTIPIVVHYFSGDKSDTKEDCYKKGEQILEALEYVPFLGGLVRGEDMSYQITDDVLQVFVTYRFITRKVTSNEDNMEELVQTNVPIN